MRAVAVAGFALAFALFATVEWAARRAGGRISTAAQVCAFVMRHEVGRVPVGRIGLLGLWWWLGWHFFAR